jgi:hypothetical protein
VRGRNAQGSAPMEPRSAQGCGSRHTDQTRPPAPRRLCSWLLSERRVRGISFVYGRAVGLFVEVRLRWSLCPAATCDGRSVQRLPCLPEILVGQIPSRRAMTDAIGPDAVKALFQEQHG